MAGPEMSDGPSGFEDPFGGQDVEQRVFGSILQTRSPTTAGAIAKQSDCDPKSAKKYLEWFADLGVVTRHDGQPVTYERNDDYFEWRRIQQLTADYTVEELQDQVLAHSNRINQYADAYGATSPAEVDAVRVAESDEGRSIDEIYADLGDWATRIEERRRLERARQELDRGASQQAPG